MTARLIYSVARAPLDVAQSALVDRLDREHPVRLLFERVVGTVDELAGRLLHDDGLRRQGAQDRSAAAHHAEAATLDAEAEATRQQAAERLRTAQAKARDERDRADHQQAEAVGTIAAQEKEAKVAASTTARERAGRAKQTASAQAAARTKKAQDDEATADATIAQREQDSTQQARDTLRAASEQRRGAARKRADAAELEDLQDT